MTWHAAERPWDLRVEHLDEPFGITEPAPRLSWKLPTTATKQLAYQLRAGDWDSGRVEGRSSTLVPYVGPQLSSRQTVSWQVKIWTEGGESEWSVPARFEMGLLDAADWTASWIEPEEDQPGEPGHRRAY